MRVVGIATALTRLANNLIQLNQEFLTEDKLYRIVGDDVDFKEFKQQDKEVKVDAVVEIGGQTPGRGAMVEAMAALVAADHWIRDRGQNAPFGRCGRKA